MKNLGKTYIFAKVLITTGEYNDTFEIRQIQEQKYCMVLLHLCKISRVGKFIEAECEMVVTKAGRERGRVA